MSHRHPWAVAGHAAAPAVAAGVGASVAAALVFRGALLHLALRKRVASWGRKKVALADSPALLSTTALCPATSAAPAGRRPDRPRRPRSSTAIQAGESVARRRHRRPIARF